MIYIFLCIILCSIKNKSPPLGLLHWPIPEEDPVIRAIWFFNFMVGFLICS